MSEYLKDHPVKRREEFLALYKTSEGYGRGVDHAHAMFSATEEFDRFTVGSRRVRIQEGHFCLESIIEDEAGAPVSCVGSLADAIVMGEVLQAIPAEMNQFDYQGHLVGFAETYNALLVEKHAETLDRLGITGTMAAVRAD